MKQIEDFYKIYSEKIKEYKKNLNKDLIIYLGLNHNGRLILDGSFKGCGSTTGLYIPDNGVNVKYYMVDYLGGDFRILEDFMICEPGNLDKIYTYILLDDPEDSSPEYITIIDSYRYVLENIYEKFLESYKKVITSISDIHTKELFIKTSIPSVARIYGLKYKSLDLDNNIIFWNDGSTRTNLSQAIRVSAIEKTLSLVKEKIP